MSIEYLPVAEDEGEEAVELPIEEDGTLLLSTLQAQYPNACGLKYRNPKSKVVRGVRLNEGQFFPPSTDAGWGSEIYFCVFPKENKRKGDDSFETSTPKTKRIETRSRCTDLIVLGLPWKTSEEGLREYFEDFGEVLMAQVKKDIKTGKSKGFGFVRFSSYDVQLRVLASRHFIDGRWCEVKVSNSKEGAIQQIPSKLFIGRCTDDLTADDLRDHFSKFGEVTDVFIPKPFRGFGFVTYLDPEIAQSVCGEDHIIKGASLHVANAVPKSEQNRYSGGPLTPNQRNGGNQIKREDNMSYPQQRGGYVASSMQNSNGWNNQTGGNLDMPNLQTLGINPQGQNPSNQGQNVNKLTTPPMNPAIVNALKQLLGNLENQNQDQGFNTSGNPNSQSANSQQGGGGFFPRMSQGGGSVTDRKLDGNQPWSRQQRGITASQGFDGKQKFF